MNRTTSRRLFVLGTAAAATSALALKSGSTAQTTTEENTMWTMRKADDRGHANHGWLNTHHTFSFANYYDPAHMGFGPLRVINDDRVAGGAGFPTHPHRDMEIITYVLEGALEHRDTTGGGGIIRPGDVQHMTAGTGVRHSEFNAHDDKPVHFLQIWIIPEAGGKEPTYNQMHFPTDQRQGRMRLVASDDGRDGSIAIGQNLSLFASVLDVGQRVEQPVGPGRKVWVHVAKGSAQLDGEVLHAGDGAYAEDPRVVTLVGREASAEVLTFDMA